MTRLMRVLDRLTEGNGIDTSYQYDFGIVFLKEISKIAPVFMSVGNHEWYFTEEDIKTFNANKITLLDNADTEVTVKGITLKIGGLSTRYDLNWLHSFSIKKGFKILLCHHPEVYRHKICGKADDTFNLIVSGHYHGGQWRMGDVGFYVPRIGLFQKGVHGRYDRLVVGSGVANTTKFPRLGNPREIVFIEI